MPGELVAARDESRDVTRPYQPLGRPVAPAAVRTGIVLVPYHSWAQRGPSAMRVRLPTTSEPPRC
ncbi:hypothetical protein ACFWBB_01155 [Streptomyces sp. NPDC060000]|uniref:hypothetical protein n=1 Tax=Streptomyces sp. NPDC060000 TaxID=3347031 RepID=UPI0036B5B0B4